MKIIDIINEVINEEYQSSGNKIWYHGTPDVREIKQTGGFIKKTSMTSYITEPKKWDELQKGMKIARNVDEEKYFKLLDQAGALRKMMSYVKPIFFTANYKVAKTYATDKTAFDFQNSEPTTLQVNINDSGKKLQVPAHGERFRGIRTDVVKKSLINSGVPEDEINKYFNMFTLNIRNGIMSAETLGIIAQLLDFDIVDVLGVLDSYHGGSVQSTVRMVFDPTRIKIIN